MRELTPFQPVGPYFHVMLRDELLGFASLVTGQTRGHRISIEGTVRDGSEAPLADGLVEIWQADAEGRYRHSEDPASGSVDPAFGGYGRAATDAQGRFRFDTIRPGRVAGPDGQLQAPHILMAILAPGILTRYWTRLYFENERSNATDQVLQLVPPARRDTLLAREESTGRYRFDVIIQGAGETVFFEA